MKGSMLGRSLRQHLLAAAKQIWPAYVVASILILYGFTWGLPTSIFQDKSFHADENAKVWIVNHIGFPYFYAGLLHKGTALLYQVYVVKTVFTLGGLLPSSNLMTLIIGRSFVYLYALAALTLLFALGRRLFDAPTGRLAALILAVSPGFVISGHYFKADVPVVFWVLLAMLMAFRVTETTRLSDVGILGLVVGYAASVKYHAAPLLAAGIAAIATGDPRIRTPSAWGCYIATVSLGFFVGTPYAVLLPSRLIASLDWVTALNRTGVPYHVGRPIGWIDYLLNVLPFALSTPLTLATVVATVWAVVKHGRRLLPIWVFLALYYLLLGMDNWRLVRYTVPLLPFLALFLARLVTDLAQRRVLGMVAGLGLATVWLYALAFSLSYVRVMALPDPRVQAGRWIAAHIPRNVPLPVVPDHYTNLPQLRSLGYNAWDTRYSIERLQQAASPYLVLSESAVRFYEEAIAYYPQQAAFLAYVRANYHKVAHFENEQRLWQIDSKRGARLPQDWLHPNTGITILRRRESR